MDKNDANITKLKNRIFCVDYIEGTSVGSTERSSNYENKAIELGSWIQWIQWSLASLVIVVVVVEGQSV
jgi:hypothetical protein